MTTAVNASVFLPFVLRNYNFRPGNLNGTIVDSQTNQPISGVTILLDGETSCSHPNRCDITAEDGRYDFYNLSAGQHILTTSREDYLDLEQSVTVVGDMTTTRNFALTLDLSGDAYRIILTWNALPEDLDAHFWLPYGEYPHIYLEKKGDCQAFPDACLDIDDTDGYGPETISLIVPATFGTYSYAVLNYYEGYPDVPSIIASGARVHLYDASGLIGQFEVPSSGSGDLWHVFDLDSATRVVTPVNCITAYTGDIRPQCP